MPRPRRKVKVQTKRGFKQDRKWKARMGKDKRVNRSDGPDVDVGKPYQPVSWHRKSKAAKRRKGTYRKSTTSTPKKKSTTKKTYRKSTYTSKRKGTKRRTYRKR